jgi:hypothetical protein
MAKRLSKAALMRNACANGSTAPESIDLGTNRFPTKPMAYENVPKKIA